VRIDWFDDKTNAPVVDEQVHKLEHFVASMADGIIEKNELEKQQASVVAAMKSVEKDLTDSQHEKVTRLLIELSAYNIMRLLHELQQARVQKAFSK
jgi:hypothetical protein